MKKHIKIFSLLLTLILTTTSFIGCFSSDNSKTINIFNAGDYINKDLISKFENETGYKINYSTYDTNEIMYTKLKSGSSKYDLVFPSDYMIEKMIEEDMLQKIDYNNIPNYKYIGNNFKNLSYDPTNEFSVPYMWGTVGIIYNPNEVKEEITNWDILWDSKYKNNIIMFDSLRDTMGIALSKLGYSMNSTNSSEIIEAADSLIEQKPLVKAYFVDQVKDAMINNEASLATVWSGDANYIMNENPSLKYFVPNNSNKWFDGMVIPKNAENKEGAEAFINFLCDPENAKENVEYIGYYTPNTEAYNLLDENTKKLYPTMDKIENLEIFKNLDSNTLKIYSEEWDRVKSK